MANKAGNWATDGVTTNVHNFAPESSLLEEVPDDADTPRRIEREHVVAHGLCLTFSLIRPAGFGTVHQPCHDEIESLMPVNA